MLPPFEQVLADHGPDVHRFLVAGVGPVDADDCFQDVVVAALRSYPSLRDARNLRGWLFTIAHHRAVDRHRAAARTATVARVPDRHGPATDPEPDGAELWDAVRALPPMQRGAVVARFVLDLPYREVGEIIGCSAAAARQNVRAALVSLRAGVGATPAVRAGEGACRA